MNPKIKTFILIGAAIISVILWVSAIKINQWNPVTAGHDYTSSVLRNCSVILIAFIIAIISCSIIEFIGRSIINSKTYIIIQLYICLK